MDIIPLQTLIDSKFNPTTKKAKSLQEVLSGIREELQFRRLQKLFAFIQDINIQREDYEQAALFFNQCSHKGVAGSHIDYLICAIAAREKMPVYTLDKDFNHYQKHIDLALYQPRRQAITQ